MKEQRPQDNPWRAMFLVSAVGADLAACLGAGYWLGSQLSGGSQLWSILGLVFGLVVAIATIYLMIKKTGGL